MTVELAAGGTIQVLSLGQQKGIDEGHEERFIPSAHGVSRGARDVVEAVTASRLRAKTTLRSFRSDIFEASERLEEENEEQTGERRDYKFEA